MQAFDTINTDDKQQAYQTLLAQVSAVIADESDTIANMANICALLKQTFNWFWIGFYRVDETANQLILAPFQGTLACTRIDYGKGVCGEAWQKMATQIVADVNQHPNHIACSSLSLSEIVVPIFAKDNDNQDKVIAVLDIDSDELNTFDEIDAQYLKELVKLL